MRAARNVGIIMLLALIVASFFVGVTGIIVPGYMQAELNKVWETQSAGALPGGEAVTSPATAEAETRATDS